MVSSKVCLVLPPTESAYRRHHGPDYYTSYPLFKDASGIAIAAIGTLSSAVQFGEVRSYLLKPHAMERVLIHEEDDLALVFLWTLPRSPTSQFMGCPCPQCGLPLTSQLRE